MIGWKTPIKSEDEAIRAMALAGTLELVEKGDLHRDGRLEGWEGVLEAIVEGCLARLERKPEQEEHEAVMAVLDATLRLSYATLEESLPSILISLASTSSTSTPAPQTTSFLSALLTHHQRSLTLPSLLLSLSNALASPSSTPNDLLTTHTFLASLSKSLGSLVGQASVRGCWEALVKTLPSPAAAATTTTEEGEEPSKKKRKVAFASEDGVDSTVGIGARLRVLAIFVKAMPSPLPLFQLESFGETYITPSIKSFTKLAKKKSAAGEVGEGREMIELRSAIVERLKLAGEEVKESVWGLGEKRVKELREVVEKGEGENVVVAVSSERSLRAREGSTLMRWLLVLFAGANSFASS